MTICPAAAYRVCANTDRDVYISDDHGSSWAHRAEDLGKRCGPAIAVHPEAPDCILATVSDGLHGEDVHGHLHAWHDAGRRRQHVTDGFHASTRQTIDTFHVTFSADGTAWAAVGPSLYRGLDRARHWELFWTAPSEIAALSCCP